MESLQTQVDGLTPQDVLPSTTDPTVSTAGNMISEVSSGSSEASEPFNLHDNTNKISEESDTSVSEDFDEPKPDSTLGLKNIDLEVRLDQLYGENVVAKICRVGTKSTSEVLVENQFVSIPTSYPEIVPQQGSLAGKYQFREPDFWTCGFFPGTLYALLERSIKFPSKIQLGDPDAEAHGVQVREVREQLRSLCQTWAAPIHGMAARTDTHDIGFIIMPALQRDWELTSNEQSLKSILRAADSLASRNVSSAGAIRSWDLLLKKEITVTDMTENLLVIIDSMCNLDLLFYAAAHGGDRNLATIAETHARTLLKTHLLEEYPRLAPKRKYNGKLYSTCHVANINPIDGSLKWRWTAQGYSNDSCWARGQSWAVLGYAQTYMWTKDKTFLDAACGAAEYFLYRLETSPSCVEVSAAECSADGPKANIGRYVPLWDFDAPVDTHDPLRDSSAGIIAANGMLIISQALQGLGEQDLASHFLDTALRIVNDTIDLSLATEKAHFVSSDSGELRVQDVVPGATFESILKHGTANNNENARRRYANHGLVYGDYYFIEFGNRLLSMGLV